MISWRRIPVKIVTSPTPPAPTRFQRLFQELRTEGGTPLRTAAAVALGIFIGCLPLWGVHLAICVLVGRMFGLSRLKMYLAANISNPLVLPFLLLAQIQAGRFVRRGDFYALTLHDVRSTSPWLFGEDLVVGSLLVGVGLGVLGAAITLVFTRTPGPTDEFLLKAADRYLVAGITPWEFARQKLTSDPVYFEVLRHKLLPDRGRLLDAGCGQGLLLSTLATAVAWHREGRWPADWPVPPELFLHGLELQPRLVRLACLALGDAASVDEGDARQSITGQWDAIALLDVLHMLKLPDQDSVLAAVTAALAPGGVLIIREAGAQVSWRFAMVYLTNRIKALLQGRWRQPLHFRSIAAWCSALEAAGLSVSTSDASQGTPFSNVLIVGRKV
jgi:uncharacterized protein (DUF2062 family)